MIRELGSKEEVILLESMIVLVIIGTVAGCSNSTATKIEVVTKQWEAKKILQKIYVMGRAYREKHGFYWDTDNVRILSASCPHGFATLGIRIMPFARYTYAIFASRDSDNSAVATCGTSDDDPTFGTWDITDSGELRVVSNETGW